MYIVLHQVRGQAALTIQVVPPSGVVQQKTAIQYTATKCNEVQVTQNTPKCQ